ncbi:hypothetical protein Tdes44962_MAKER03781 [Teratosphaeria destructans]|uniref:Uncharacterized protein n=1 Tax=Teratosphaeria destructans TaxID=418781 RepID=A0A9W7W0P9_9PEZI|nr:hypothetical protein Tdes44962_MAKER03781 [Teratosphaeria destructans]
MENEAALDPESRPGHVLHRPHELLGIEIVDMRVHDGSKAWYFSIEDARKLGFDLSSINDVTASEG